MNLQEIIKALEGRVLTPSVNLDREVTCAFSADLISDILMCTKEPTMLLTGLTNLQVVRLADMIDLFAIVFIRGKMPSQEIIDMAVERDLPLIATDFTMYKSCGTLYNLGLRSCKI